jgi:hypothetical protein
MSENQLVTGPIFGVLIMQENDDRKERVQRMLLILEPPDR